MTQVTITFDPNDDRHDYLCAVHGRSFHSTLGKLRDAIENAAAKRTFEGCSAQDLAAALKRDLDERLNPIFFGLW
jgi:hypothetical protein